MLAIDPFFTRPGLSGLVKPVESNFALVAEKLPACNFVLVTHSHWDHLMDVAEVIRLTGASAYGSANTCQLLRIRGALTRQVNEIQMGDTLSLGVFDVEVIPGHHGKIPLANIFNGSLHPNLRSPLRLQDYRMDVCLGYCIEAMGTRVLVCGEQPQLAAVLFAVAQEEREYYQRLFTGTQPQIFVPIHWDDFLRPLTKPIRRIHRPGGLSLMELTNLAHGCLPYVNVIIPEIFREYTLG